MKRLISTYILSIMMLTAFSQELVRLQKPAFNKIVVKLMFNNGSVSDPTGKEGLTYLTARLMEDGATQNFTKAQIEDKIYPMAAQISVNVDKEVSTFTFEFPVKYANNFHEIIEEIILRPAFNEDDFNRIKSNQLVYVTEVIKTSSDEDYSKMALEAYMFKGTPYEHMVVGTAEGIQSITLQDVKEHYGRYFTKNNVLAGIAGNFNEEYASKVKATVGQLSNNAPILPGVIDVKMPKGIEVQIVQKENALGSTIFGGYPIYVSRADDEFAALMVANSYLGEHRKAYGRLYQEIREKRSMNYGDYTYIEWYEQGGSNQLPPAGVPRSSNYFALWIRPVQIAEAMRAQYPEMKDVKTGHAHFALRMAFYEINRLVKEGISQDDFELTRDFLANYIKMYVETPERELGFLMDSKFYGRENYIEELGGLLSKVTLPEVNAAIKKHLQVENMYISIITDDSEAQPLAESLKQNLASPMGYTNIVREGLPEDVVQKDKVVEVFPLNVTNVQIINSKNMFVE